MKFQKTELPMGKSQPKRRPLRVAPIITIAIFMIFPLCYYLVIKDTSKKFHKSSSFLGEVVVEEEEESPLFEKKNYKPDMAVPTIEIDAEMEVVKKGHEIGSPETYSKKQDNDSTEKQEEFMEKGSRNKEESSRDEAKVRIKRNKPRSRSNERVMIRSKLMNDKECDLFSGEWVPKSDGPYYTNDTCNAIQEHQNCLKFGRPDRDYLKWRWKPDDCELPAFNADEFLRVVRGKSIAFVGDSVARNHMQSLICLLSRVADPIDDSDPLDQNKRYEFKEHDFNISMFWAPYLVRTEKTDNEDEKRPFKLYLDESDTHWGTQIASHDFLIISAGHWFFRPTYFYDKKRIVGCLYCSETNVTHLTSYFSYRRAFRTAFRTIIESDFNGVTFLRTYAPSHFEGAPWDKGGDCVRTKPFKRNDVVLEDYSLEMYLIQLEELRIAQKLKGKKNRGFRLFDATRAMLLRPDGHPSKYGRWQGVNQSFPNDCVHWCLPGPIDSWNDFLQELLKREMDN